MRRATVVWSLVVLVALVGIGLVTAQRARFGNAESHDSAGGARSAEVPSERAQVKGQPRAEGYRGAGPDRELIVSAASSLQDAFQRLATEFERTHRGVRVTLNFAGSQRLRTQIEQGAPVDVFASADRGYVEALNEKGLTGPGRTFATDELVVIVPRANPAGIGAFGELPRAERIVLGAPGVPVGDYAETVLQAAAGRYGASFAEGVETHIASRELNVRQVSAKVGMGEADAGIVYQSVAASAGDRVRAVTVPDDLNAEAEYVIAVVEQTSVPALARAWVDFVGSPYGQRLLAEHGFTPAAGAGDS